MHPPTVSDVYPEGGHYFMMWCVQMPACNDAPRDGLLTVFCKQTLQFKINTPDISMARFSHCSHRWVLPSPVTTRVLKRKPCCHCNTELWVNLCLKLWFLIFWKSLKLHHEIIFFNSTTTQIDSTCFLFLYFSYKIFVLETNQTQNYRWYHHTGTDVKLGRCFISFRRCLSKMSTQTSQTEIVCLFNQQVQNNSKLMNINPLLILALICSLPSPKINF